MTIGESKKIDQMIESVRKVAAVDEASGIPQSNFTMEESAEFIQAVMKIARGKDTKEHMMEEAMDIVSTVLVLMVREDIPFINLVEHIKMKCDRAVARYERNGEV